MKLIGMLLVIVSLTFGAIFATTAYLPELSLSDEKLLPTDADGNPSPLTLAAPAAHRTAEGAVDTIGETNDVLTSELLADLRAAGIKRIRVKEFSVGRWSHAIWFPLAMIGLIVGGLLVRMEAKRAAAAEPHPESTRATPMSALDAMRSIVDGLLTDLPGITSAEARLHEIVHRLDEIQKEHVLVIVDNRASLTARLGMARFAQFMDAFSVAERKINRAWSAAADESHDESIECLEEVPEMLERARSMV